MKILRVHYSCILRMSMLESKRKHERSLECTQLLVLSSDWSLQEFGNVTNAGTPISPDLPVLCAEVWLVRLCQEMGVEGVTL